MVNTILPHNAQQSITRGEAFMRIAFASCQSRPPGLRCCWTWKVDPVWLSGTGIVPKSYLYANSLIMICQ